MQVKTIVLSVSSIGNLAALTLLILVIVSMLGHNLFYNVNLAQAVPPKLAQGIRCK